MRKTSQYSYITEPLDPDILTTPFQVETSWHVITGAACTGKTTLINQLVESGYKTIPEIARKYFDRELASGKTLEMIIKDGLEFQSNIAELQLSEEGSIDPDQLVFLDRGVPDPVTFLRIFGHDPNKLLSKCFRYRYASIFILDRLPLQRENTLGPEDETSSEFLDEWLAYDYRALGYNVIRVPPFSPQERLAFVLERVAKKAGSGSPNQKE
jgi:predicted ATPase